jgi:hypothetical protein
MWRTYYVFMYENGKMDLLKLFQEWERGNKRRILEGVISTMIYCKNICKCHNVSPV